MVRFAQVMPVLACCLFCSNVASSNAADSLEGTLALKSIGPIAFAPDAVLLISDPLGAKLYAVETGDVATSPDGNTAALNVEDLGGQVEAMLGTDSDDVQIVDLAVCPDSHRVYLSVMRGSGPDAIPVVLRVDRDGQLDELSLKSVRYRQTGLPNPPTNADTRRGDPRLLTITDLAYVDGRVYVAGLSNEEFASKLRSIEFPFSDAVDGASIEIFHGAHGRIETNAPIMTFTSYEIEDETHVVAAYTCTPLVKIPVKQLEAGAKVRGTTVAELGNRNRPIDIFVYQQNGRDYILMANTSRGVMKILTDGIGTGEGIVEPVRGGGTAGLTYDTVEGWNGIVQLDRWDDGHALVLAQADNGQLDLRTVPLP